MESEQSSRGEDDDREFYSQGKQDCGKGHSTKISTENKENSDGNQGSLTHNKTEKACLLHSKTGKSQIDCKVNTPIEFSPEIVAEVIKHCSLQKLILVTLNEATSKTKDISSRLSNPAIPDENTSESEANFTQISGPAIPEEDSSEDKANLILSSRPAFPEEGSSDDKANLTLLSRPAFPEEGSSEDKANLTLISNPELSDVSGLENKVSPLHKLSGAVSNESISVTKHNSSEISSTFIFNESVSESKPSLTEMPNFAVPDHDGLDIKIGSLQTSNTVNHDENTSKDINLPPLSNFMIPAESASESSPLLPTDILLHENVSRNISLSSEGNQLSLKLLKKLRRNRRMREQKKTEKNQKIYRFTAKEGQNKGYDFQFDSPSQTENTPFEWKLSSFQKSVFTVPGVASSDAKDWPCILGPIAPDEVDPLNSALQLKADECIESTLRTNFSQGKESLFKPIKASTKTIRKRKKAVGNEKRHELLPKASENEINKSHLKVSGNEVNDCRVSPIKTLEIKIKCKSESLRIRMHLGSDETFSESKENVTNKPKPDVSVKINLEKKFSSLHVSSFASSGETVSENIESLPSISNPTVPDEGDSLNPTIQLKSDVCIESILRNSSQKTESLLKPAEASETKSTRKRKIEKRKEIHEPHPEVSESKGHDYVVSPTKTLEFHVEFKDNSTRICKHPVAYETASENATCTPGINRRHYLDEDTLSSLGILSSDCLSWLPKISENFPKSVDSKNRKKVTSNLKESKCPPEDSLGDLPNDQSTSAITSGATSDQEAKSPQVREETDIRDNSKQKVNLPTVPDFSKEPNHNSYDLGFRYKVHRSRQASSVGRNTRSRFANSNRRESICFDLGNKVLNSPLLTKNSKEPSKGIEENVYTSEVNRDRMQSNSSTVGNSETSINRLQSDTSKIDNNETNRNLYQPDSSKTCIIETNRNNSLSESSINNETYYGLNSHRSQSNSSKAGNSETSINRFQSDTSKIDNNETNRNQSDSIKTCIIETNRNQPQSESSTNYDNEAHFDICSDWWASFSVENEETCEIWDIVIAMFLQLLVFTAREFIYEFFRFIFFLVLIFIAVLCIMPSSGLML